MSKKLVSIFLFVLIFFAFSYSEFGRFGKSREPLKLSKKAAKANEIYINGIITEEEINEAREELTRQMKSLSLKDVNASKVGFDSMELDLSSVAYPVVVLSDGIETGGFAIAVEICAAFNNLLLAHKKCVVVPTDNEYVSASFLRQGLHSPSYKKVGLDADYIVTKASVLALGQKGRSLLRDTKYLDLLLKLGSEPMFFMVKKGSDINTFYKLREYLLDNIDTKQRIFIGNKKYAFDIVAFFASLQLPVENLQFMISEDKDAVISDFCAKGSKEDILIEYFHSDSTKKIEASGCVSQLEMVYFTRQELDEVLAGSFSSVADVVNKIPKLIQDNYYKLSKQIIDGMVMDGDMSEADAVKQYKGVYVPTTDIVLAASRNADGKEVFQMIMSYLYSFTSIRKNNNIYLMLNNIKRGNDLLSPYVGTDMIYHPVVVNYPMFNDLFLGNKSLKRMEKEFMTYTSRALLGKSSSVFLPAIPSAEQMAFLIRSEQFRKNAPPPPPPIKIKPKPAPPAQGQSKDGASKDQNPKDAKAPAEGDTSKTAKDAKAPDGKGAEKPKEGDAKKAPAKEDTSKTAKDAKAPDGKGAEKPKEGDAKKAPAEEDTNKAAKDAKAPDGKSAEEPKEGDGKKAPAEEDTNKAAKDAKAPDGKSAEEPKEGDGKKAPVKEDATASDAKESETKK